MTKATARKSTGFLTVSRGTINVGILAKEQYPRQFNRDDSWNKAIDNCRDIPREQTER